MSRMRQKASRKPSIAPRRGATVALLAVFALSTLWPMSGGAAGKEKKGKRREISQPAWGLVWPLPPQRPRVRYVTQIALLTDAEGTQPKKRNWLDRLAGVPAPESKPRLRKPNGVAVDSAGRIYVADGHLRLVLVFDLDKRTVDYRGNNPGAEFTMPIGVAVDDQDRLYVSDGHRALITCFSPQGDALAVLGHQVVERPTGLAVDRARKRLYVADTKANRIAMFNTETFQLEGYLGSPSTSGEREPGKFAAPTNLTVDGNGNLYVTDTWNHRVQIFDAKGKFLRAFGEHGTAVGNFVRPKGIAVDPEGHIYVADAEFNNIQVFTPEGQPLLAIGAWGTAPGQFALIAGLAIDRNGRIYATDQWEGRLQIFQYLPESPPAEAKVNLP